MILLLIVVACETQPKKEVEQVEEVTTSAQVNSVNQHLVDSLNRVFNKLDLVDITLINSSIQVDLKYATKDNFMHVVLYDTLTKVYLQREVAERLSKCQDYLDSLKPGYALIVFDGVRPQQVQREMWEAMDSVPVYRRGKFVSNPGKGSVHNFGAAVDVSIVDAKGKLLDMGAGYDDFRRIAFPQHEAEFLATGELSQHQVNNRKLLRRVMASQKFQNIPSEWWHFNAYSRITASHRYKMLVTESGETKWFRIVPKKDSTAVEESL